MHKVTASAVILTAITGCSQSEAPSAQWSFEAPAETAVDTVLTQHNAFGGENPAAFSPDTQQFVISAARNKMGPAFEQPSSTGLLPAPAGNQTSVSSEAATVSTADEVRSLLASQSRTDPIAQVRSYLSAARSTQGSGSLVDRVPYSSQVSVPASPIYTPTATFSEEAVPVAFSGNTAQAIADFNQQESNLPRPQVLSAAAQPVASLLPSLQAPSSLQTASLQAAADVGFIPVVPSGTVLSDAVPSGTVLSDTGATSSSVEDGLPVLPAAQPQADLAGRELAVAPTQQPTQQVSDRTFLRADQGVRANEIPIGTAILRDLQINAALNPPSEIPSTTAASAVISGESVAVSSELSAIAPSPELTVSYTSPVIESDIEQVSAQLTLAQLAQTIPQHQDRFEEEPLIASFQTAQDNLRQVSTAYSNPFQPNSASEASELETSELEPLSQALEREANQLPRENHSPLLEGLETSVDELGALQTLYMPIPTSPLPEASATLIRSAISTLSNDVDSAVWLNDLKAGAIANLTDSLIPVGYGLESPASQAPAVPAETPDITSERPSQPNETAQLISFEIDRPRSHSAQVKASKTKHSDNVRSNVRPEQNGAFPAPARISSLSNSYRQRIVWQ
ncbi:MAG: hypothetical protein WBG63_00865 [Phormidesmis sp.]